MADDDRWMRWLDEAIDDPADRLVEVGVEEIVHEGRRIGVVTIRFGAEDLRGTGYVATARLFVPASVLDGPTERLAVWFSCGYQVPNDVAVGMVRTDRIVVTPCDPELFEVFPLNNPLARGTNTDVVLSHLVRGMHFVDPARIVYAGGSAGGYATLLVAAEAFPVAAAVPTAPVVNMVYLGAYMMANCARIAADPPVDQPMLGMLMGGFAQFIEFGWIPAFGGDVSAPAWFDHSPIAHLERITCPVAAFFSTADFLVPIEQVGSQLAAATLAALPDGVTMAADDLTSEPRASLRLVDVLGDAADVRLVPVPEGAVQLLLDDVDLTMTTPQTPVPIDDRSADGCQWLVTVVDEGPTLLGVGHTRYTVQPDFEAFVGHALLGGIAVDQLTEAKLEQLIDRWSGTEWLAEGFHHLDLPAAERADVERGLRTYCGASPDHARRFATSYAHLPPSRQVLPAGLVSELTEAAH